MYTSYTSSEYFTLEFYGFMTSVNSFFPLCTGVKILSEMIDCIYHFEEYPCATFASHKDHIRAVIK